MKTESFAQAKGESLPLAGEKLEEGARGASVEMLAHALMSLGYLSPEDQRASPSLFGPKMKSALKVFQLDHELAADGAYGPRTRAMLLRLRGYPMTGPSAEPSRAQGVTLAELREIMPKLPEGKAVAYREPLNAAMLAAAIFTRKRQAAFLAQVAHESDEFRYFEELATGEAYEGRKDLGNTQPGDGRRYKGRGPIQLTGRINYRLAGQKLGVELEGQPELAAQPAVGFRVAAWFWSKHSLNLLADVDDFDSITRILNGGFNGKAQRDAYYQRALKVLAGEPAKVG